MSGIQIGDKVYTRVHVCGEWKRCYEGIVVAQSPDGTVSDVDVMGLHGGKPWIKKEVTSHLERAEAIKQEAKR